MKCGAVRDWENKAGRLGGTQGVETDKYVQFSAPIDELAPSKQGLFPTISYMIKYDPPELLAAGATRREGTVGRRVVIAPDSSPAPKTQC